MTPPDDDTNTTTDQRGQTVGASQYNAARDIHIGHAGDNIDTGGGDYVARDKIVYSGLTHEQVVELVVELKHADQPTVWDGRTPYLGLNAFQESDAEFFFGREELVAELLTRVDRAGFVTIAGPSGSGKSSVARAGLFHALREGKLPRSETWALATMLPGNDPLLQLARALDRLAGSPGFAAELRQSGDEPLDPLLLHDLAETLLTDDKRQRLVLLVDQFEELFTQTKDAAARDSFIRLLTTAAQQPDGRAKVVISLRSDFVSNVAAYDDLRQLLSQEFQLVGAMRPRDLAKAVILPSLEVGSEIEPALVKQIIDDMKGEPGALPLMSFALQDLFEAETPPEGPGYPMDLKLAEYVKRGGLETALQRHAEEVFAGFNEEQEVLARSIFSKLITVGEGRLDTSRTAAFAELVPAGTDPALVVKTVTALSDEDARLVTARGIEAIDEAMDLTAVDASVTIAHEKLIDAWPWLRELVDQNREIIKLQNQIRSDAHAWSAIEDSGFLYRGGRLGQVEERLDELGQSLDALSQRFIAASQAARRAEIAAEAEHIREGAALAQERANAGRLSRQRRWLSLAVGVAVVAFVVAGVLGLVQRQTAQELQTLKNSIQASQLAQATALAEEPELKLLLATVALGLSYQADTRTAFDVVANELTVLEMPSAVYFAAFSPDGSQIVTAGSDTTARLWDAAGNELAVLGGHTGPVNSAAFSPDGSQIVTASDDNTARLWDAEGTALAVLDGHTSSVFSAAFSPSGSHIVSSSGDSTARLWDTAGNALAVLEGHTDWIRSAAFSPDGSLIVTASWDGTARLWDTAGKELAVLNRHTSSFFSAAFSPDGSQIVTASSDGTARLWDAAGNALAVLEGHTGDVRSAAFNPDGSLIITAGGDSTATLWNARGNKLAVLLGHSLSVNSAAFSPDGSRILTASNDGTIRLWRWLGGDEERIATARERLGDRVFSDAECARFFNNEPDSCPQSVEELWGLFEELESHD